MITKFEIFERKIYITTRIENLSTKNQNIYNELKFKVGEPVRLKKVNLIFYIDSIDMQKDSTWYHIEDDKYIYSGIYQDYELEKLSDEEKMTLKYNL